jgi:hypothetical protein
MDAARAHSQDPALRAEHDTLAARLATRQSVDEVRRGAWALLGLVVTGGAAGKLAYDRWGPHHPQAFQGSAILFYPALCAALACAAVAVLAVVRARRHMRVEDADFARLRELRALLGIDG